MSEHAHRHHSFSKKAPTNQKKNNYISLEQKIALKKLKEEIKGSQRLQFLTPPQNKNLIRLQIDTNNDFANDLKLQFVRNGDQVAVTATSLVNEAKTAVEFNINPHKPEMFYIWHYISSNGREPFRLFFSLLPQHRAILNLYDELPDDLYQKLAAEIQNSSGVGVKAESVSGKEGQLKIKSQIGKDKLDLANYQHPGALQFLDAADELSVHSQRNYATNSVEHIFRHNGKEVGTLNVDDCEFPRKEALIISPKQSKEQKQGNTKHGTFKVPVQVGDDKDRSYELIVIPGRKGKPGSVGVSFKHAKGQVTWGHTVPVVLPASKDNKYTYRTELFDNHLAIYFEANEGTVDKNELAIPHLNIYYQKQVHLDPKKADLMDKGETVKAKELMSYELYGLHLYTSNGVHGSFIAYYRHRELQTGKSNETDQTHQVDAVRDARKHYRTPPATQTVDDIKEEMVWQGNAFIREAWKHPKMKSQRVVINSSYSRYANIQDTLPHIKRHEINVSGLYDAYCDAMLAINALTPIIIQVKKNGGKFARTMKMEALLNSLADSVEHFEVSGDIAFMQMNTSKLMPKYKRASEKIRQGQLQDINVRRTLLNFEESMLGITKHLYAKVIKQELNIPVAKRLAQLDSIGKMGNRQHNLDKYVHKKKLGDGVKMIPVDVRFYPKKPPGEKKSRLTKEWDKKGGVPVMKIPVYVHKKEEEHTWHIFSLAHHDFGKYFSKELPLKGNDQKKYKDSPPPALFDLLDDSDHLPSGWLIYTLPEKHQKDDEHPPLQITKHWTPEEIATWLSVALLVFGAAAYTGGFALLMESSFMAATVIGGVGAFMAKERKEENGTMKQGDYLLTYMDIASSVVAALTFSKLLQVIRKGGGFFTPSAGAIRQGNYLLFGLKVADLGIDTIVVTAMNAQASDHIGAIMASPGSLDEKLGMLSKTFALLAVQNVMVIGTYKGRMKDIGQVLKYNNVPHNNAMPPSIMEANAPELFALKHSANPKWSTDALEEVAENIGAKKLNKIADTLENMDDSTRQILKSMYPEKDLLYALSASKGNVAKARKRLAKFYEVKNEPDIFKGIKDEQIAKAHLNDMEAIWKKEHKMVKQAEYEADWYQRNMVAPVTEAYEQAFIARRRIERKIGDINEEIKGYSGEKKIVEANKRPLAEEADKLRKEGDIGPVSWAGLRDDVNINWKNQKADFESTLKKAKADSEIKIKELNDYKDKYLPQKNSIVAKKQKSKNRRAKRKLRKFKNKPQTKKWQDKERATRQNIEQQYKNELSQEKVKIDTKEGKIVRTIPEHDAYLKAEQKIVDDLKKKIDRLKMEISALDKKITQGEKMLAVYDNNAQRKGLGYWLQREQAIDKKIEGIDGKKAEIASIEKGLPGAKVEEKKLLNRHVKKSAYQSQLEKKAKRMKTQPEYINAKKDRDAAKQKHRQTQEHSLRMQDKMRNRHFLMGWYRRRAAVQQQLTGTLKQIVHLMVTTKSGSVDADKAVWCICRTFLSMEGLPSEDPVYQVVIARQLKDDFEVLTQKLGKQLAKQLDVTSLDHLVSLPVTRIQATQQATRLANGVNLGKLQTTLTTLLQNLRQQVLVLNNSQQKIEQLKNK